MTLWLAAAVFWSPPAWAQGEQGATRQETEAEPAARALLQGIRQQIQRNEERLSQLREADQPDAFDLVLRRAAEGFVTRGANGVDVHDVSFPLLSDATMHVRDPNGNKGLVLTGKWIVEYARLIKLEPAYEQALAGYRAQAELQSQLVAEYEGALEVKKAKEVVLNDLVEAERRRGELYKGLAEASRPSLFERVLRKLAFPAGLAVGVVTGVLISEID